MDRNECRFTVLFQPPFWVGIGERWTQEGYTYDVIDSGVGPANCLLFERDGSPVLLASNREIDEVALYEIFS